MIEGVLALEIDGDGAWFVWEPDHRDKVEEGLILVHAFGVGWLPARRYAVQPTHPSWNLLIILDTETGKVLTFDLTAYVVLPVVAEGEGFRISYGGHSLYVRDKPLGDAPW